MDLLRSRVAARAAVVLVAALAGARVLAADADLPFRVPGHGALALAVPENWNVETRALEDPAALSMRLVPGDGREAVVLVTVIASPKGPPTAEFVRAAAEQVASDLRDHAAEERLAVETRSGPAARLAFVSATDRRWRDRVPPEGEWRHVTQGAAAIGDLLLGFTVLTTAKGGPAQLQALDLLARARHLPKGAGAGTVAIASGGATLAAELPGLEVTRVTARPGGGGMMVSGALTGGVNVTLTVEGASELNTVEEVREARWTRAAARSPVDKTEVQQSMRGEMAIVSYLVPRFEDVEIRQRHVHGYLLRQGAVGEVHVSKVRFEAADAALLDRVVNSTHLR